MHQNGEVTTCLPYDSHTIGFHDKTRVSNLGMVHEATSCLSCESQ